MTRDPAIIVVTGAQAAGKTTVGRLLAERFERGAFVEADALQRMIVSGRIWVTDVADEPGRPSGEALAQLRLRLRNSCMLARSFFEEGFTVVIDDVILGERFDHLREDLAGLPFYLVVLAPSIPTVEARDAARDKTVGGGWAEYLDREFRATMSGTGLWIDSTDQTPEETVNEIVRRLDEGLIES